MATSDQHIVAVVTSCAVGSLEHLKLHVNSRYIGQVTGNHEQWRNSAFHVNTSNNVLITAGLCIRYIIMSTRMHESPIETCSSNDFSCPRRLQKRTLRQKAIKGYAANPNPTPLPGMAKHQGRLSRKDTTGTSHSTTHSQAEPHQDRPSN